MLGCAPAARGAPIRMILLGCFILVIGLVLTIVGVRGRVFGEAPFCRACGFNLRGRDETSTSPRCSECGAELSDPARSMRIGVRHRRWRWLGPGLAISLISAAALSWAGTHYFLDYNF